MDFTESCLSSLLYKKVTLQWDGNTMTNEKQLAWTFLITAKSQAAILMQENEPHTILKQRYVDKDVRPLQPIRFILLYIHNHIFP